MLPHSTKYMHESKCLYDGIEHAAVFVVGAQALHGSERAHLRFAHAETLIPLTCLLGLFLNVEGA